MYKKKPFFIVFEGIEGSGKSYQIKKLYNNLKKKGLKILKTREPGGTKGAERIRKLILKDYFEKNKSEEFDKYTDTLLYLAARNEHIKKKIEPALKKKLIVLCDRFVDSTLAYQVSGKIVKPGFIENIHNEILPFKPNLTFVLKVKIGKALKRLQKRRKKNRYDKFSKSFYIKAQKAFLKIAKKNKKKYYVIDNSTDSMHIEKKILEIVLNKLK
tara:strand:- start:1897 stop:2538 length:642 start_codon:yes stop_codon:yes gene_type:complete